MTDNLKTCKSCGKEIAKSAKKCPHCGANLGMATWLKVIIVLVILGIVSIVLVVACTAGTASVVNNAVNAASKSLETSSSPESSAADDSSSSSGPTKDNSSSSEPAKKLTQQIYDTIKSATTDITGSGKLTYSGGSKFSDLVKQIGEPSSTSEVSIGDATTVTAIWSDLSYSFSSGSKFVVLSVSYDKASGQITSKSMTNF